MRQQILTFVLYLLGAFLLRPGGHDGWANVRTSEIVELVQVRIRCRVIFSVLASKFEVVNKLRMFDVRPDTVPTVPIEHIYARIELRAVPSRADVVIDEV